MNFHPSFHAATTPHKPACIDAASGSELTYAELETLSNQHARMLRQAGLVRGDVIAFMLDNSLDFFVLATAAQRCGLHYTAIPAGLGASEAAYILRDSGATVCVLHDRHALRLGEEFAAAAGGCRLYAWSAAYDGRLAWSPAVALHPALPVADESPGRDMLYSSGTTGRPKGVRLPLPEGAIGDATAQIEHLRRAYGMDASTVYLSPAPLYHAAPLRTAMNVLRLGGTVVFMREFDAAEALALLARFRVTHSQWVPTMFVRMLKLPQAQRTAYDLSHHRCAIHGAAPCAPETKRAMISWWGPILMEYYAATESVGLVVCDSHEWLAHPGTVGRPVIGEIRILDEDARELGPGEEGLVHFAGGPSFAYHNDAEKTAKARSPQGWITLGDVGYLDQDGFLYLTDRKDFMIITGGVNVYPQEIENALLAHPCVADAAVFGVPHEDFGEQVMAVVEPLAWPASESDLAETLKAHCRAVLAPVKCPRVLVLERHLPRLATGKLAKRSLRDQYWKGAGRRI